MVRRLIWGPCGTTEWKLLGGKDPESGEDSTDQGQVARMNEPQPSGTERTHGWNLGREEARTGDKTKRGFQGDRTGKSVMSQVLY